MSTELRTDDPKTPRAFVLMPFEPEFDSVYRDLIQPALEDAGFVCTRADSLLDQQNVMKDVVHGIGSADLVVAELTGLNANVLYEVGLAHGLGIPTVLLAQNLEEVPFDLRSYRIQVYSTRFDEIGELKGALGAIATQHLEGQVTFGSPVSDFLGREPVQRNAEPKKGSIVPGNEDEADDEPGFLDELAELEEAGERLEEIGARLARATGDIGDDLSRHAARVQEVTGQVGPGATAAARRIAAMAASDLTRYATGLESDLPGLESAVDSMFSGGLGFLARAEATSDADRRELQAAQEGARALLNGVREALGGARGMHTSLGEMTGISRDLDRAVRRVVRDLARMITALEKTEAFSEKSITVIEEKLQTPEV